MMLKRIFTRHAALFFFLSATISLGAEINLNDTITKNEQLFRILVDKFDLSLDKLNNVVEYELSCNKHQKVSAYRCRNRDRARGKIYTLRGISFHYTNGKIIELSPIYLVECNAFDFPSKIPVIVRHNDLPSVGIIHKSERSKMDSGLCFEQYDIAWSTDELDESIYLEGIETTGKVSFSFPDPKLASWITLTFDKK